MGQAFMPTCANVWNPWSSLFVRVKQNFESITTDFIYE